MQDDNQIRFTLYLDYWTFFDLLDVEERGKLVLALLDYCKGERPDFGGNRVLEMAYRAVTLEAEREKAEAEKQGA